MLDTRSPNKISVYFLLVIMLILLACGFTAGIENVIPHNGYIEDNQAIRSEVIRLAKNIQRYCIYFRNFDNEKASAKLQEITKQLEKEETADAAAVPEYDVFGRLISDDAEFDREHTINGPNYETRFYTADMSGKDNIPHPEELYLTDTENVSENELSTLIENLSEALDNYENVQDYLLSVHDLHFYVYDTAKNVCLATNTEDIFNEKYYDYVKASAKASDSIFNEPFTGESLNLSFVKNNCICIISIPVTGLSSQMQSEINYTYRIYSINKVVSSVLLPTIFYILSAIIFIYILAFGKKELSAFIEKAFTNYMHLPLTFKLLFDAMACFHIGRLVMYEDYSLTYQIANGYIPSAVLRIVTVLLCFFALFMALVHFFKYFRRRIHLKDEPEARIMNDCIKDILIAASEKEQLVVCADILLIIVASLPIPSLIIMASHSTALTAIFFICVYCIYCFVIWLLFKYINNASKLRYYISEMAKGHISSIPEEKGVFSRSLNNLNNINSGLKDNLEEMIKSERLKTELITNVSHDLKTPLTSIINYLSLLKALDIEDTQAKEYIDIANDKARRLNILIQDLFEASKLNSGQMKIEKMPSDVVSLLKQTLGELDYKISLSGIDFKTTLPDHPIIINMDGQRMWRVFDNLLNNILKYSPQGSRGYINLDELDDRVIITFKNVSNYPLDFDGAELFERFKRGDVSRSTEGSGLGLSIAKSIVELHGGTLEIVIDGDLFKAIVILFKPEQIAANIKSESLTEIL